MGKIEYRLVIVVPQGQCSGEGAVLESVPGLRGGGDSWWESMVNVEEEAAWRSLSSLKVEEELAAGEGGKHRLARGVARVGGSRQGN